MSCAATVKARYTHVKEFIPEQEAFKACFLRLLPSLARKREGFNLSDDQRRKAIATLNEERFLDFQNWSAEQQKNNELPPYRLANEFIDYALIENQARQLIESFQPRPKSELKQEYRDNARTAIFEALTASGHISEIEITGTLEEVNKQVLDRLLNGYYDPGLPEHEKKRRFREICEELIIQEVQRRILAGELPPDTEIASESTYVLGMSDEAAMQIGYRPYNKKGMTRSTGLLVHPEDKVTRVIEQVSYSNSSAHESIQRLHGEGISVDRTEKADIDLLGAQTIYSRSDLAEGVIGIQRRIDAFQGASVRFGEEINEHLPTYENIREVSRERESKVEMFIDSLAEWEAVLDKSLEAGEITRQQWAQLYMKEVRDIVRSICVLEPSYTKDAFGEAVVADYQAANNSMRYGNTTKAAAIVSGASGREQAIVLCGNSISTSSEFTDSPSNNANTVKQKLDMAKEKWKWEMGVCQVSNCPTRPKKTAVGPCSVCAGCQNHYDNGDDPHKIYRKMQDQNSESKPLFEPQTETGISTKDVLKNLKLIRIKTEAGGAKKIYENKETGELIEI